VRSLGVLFACALAASCSRDREPEPQSGVVVKAPASSETVPLRRVPLRSALGERIVAVGDLHGDLAATRAALRLAGAIDASDHWSGGKSIVVQTGDQIDRGDDDRKVLDLLGRLTDEAKKAGGALHVLNGNHETMNAAGDFRYVTPGGFRAFADFKAGDGAETPALARFGRIERGRALAFIAGGPYARKLAERQTILLLGDSVFVHGGVTDVHVRYGVDRINAEVSRFLRGELASLPPFLERDDAPMWARVYSSDPVPARACAMLEQVLAELGARRMVVGHTVQKSGISHACGQRVFRIDVGLSSFYGGPCQVLEIRGRDVRVLRAPSKPAP
jgi:hypothetical protein